jgi:hypothetical protein
LNIIEEQRLLSKLQSEKDVQIILMSSDQSRNAMNLLEKETYVLEFQIEELSKQHEQQVLKVI